MMVTNRFSLNFKKTAGQNTVFRLEIAVALLVKFLLLGGIWWLFFAGNKQPVDEASIAGKIFGDQHSAIISEKTGSVLNDQQ